ncbi:MAG: hypothetical protein EAZ07_04995 [Cytophagales bacterium]|nr:MAG: hypothetical protein EAZ07_04995 [Cytophagales bacterium]
MGIFDFEQQKSKSVIDNTQDSDPDLQNKRMWVRKIFVLGLSFLGAAVLWFLSALNHNYTSYIKYPIKIVYDANQYVPLRKLPTYVSLNATGYGWDFLRKTLSVKKKPVLLKPNNLPRRKFYTDSELLIAFSHQLSTIKVNFFETDTVFFEFDVLTSKKVFIQIDTSQCTFINKQQDLYFKTIPEYINVSGAKSILDKTSDSIKIALNHKELELGFSEVVEVGSMINSSLKSDAAEIEIVIEQKKP